MVILVGLEGEMDWTSYWDIKGTCSSAEEFVRDGWLGQEHLHPAVDMPKSLGQPLVLC